MSSIRPTGKMHASHELDVKVVSPEEAESGIAEFWAGARLFGFTWLEDGELLLTIEPWRMAARSSSARTAWPRRWRGQSSSSNPRDPHYRPRWARLLGFRSGRVPDASLALRRFTWTEPGPLCTAMESIQKGGQHEHHRPGAGLDPFIVSDDVERSRRFYTDVLGGRTVISGEADASDLRRARQHAGSSSTSAEARPTTSPRSRSRRRAIPTGSTASSTSGSRTSRRCTPMERAGRPVPDAAEAAPVRDPLLHPRPRRLSDRGRANH